MNTPTFHSRTAFRGTMVLLLAGAWLLPAGAAIAQTEGDAEFAALQADARKSFKEVVSPFVETYCQKCHGQRRQRGGINLESAVKHSGDTASTKMFKKALASVKTHDMPPDDQDKQPSDAERQRFLDGVAKIKFLSTKDPGEFVIRRLTKMEYANTLRDLLGLDPSVAHELPDDVAGEGYLNTLSPLQMEQYLAIANQALDQALAPPGKRPTKVQKQLLGDPPRRGADERQSAGNVARSLAREAFRRPASEAELETLVGVYDLGRMNQFSHDAAMRLMLKAVLVSPQFLFITPAEPADRQTIVKLDDYQLASRLSYLIWASMPDAQLMALADRGTLHEPANLKAQVKRMLADERSRALFDGFGAQWLGLGGLQSKTFDPAKFPQMTGEMRAAMYDEARLFFESIVRENRSIITFVDGDYTFLNADLAKIYGLEKKVSGSKFRKVNLTDANRGGILGMPGVLAVTSFPNRTSPVKRGVWVLEQVLGEKIPTPPPNVPALEKQDQQKVANMTLRQRTMLHQTDPVCANCHKVLDPIGFGLENFDAIGCWREQDDSGGPIDAGGELPGGKHFSTPRELKAIIASKSDQLARNLAEKLLAFALCRQLEGYDEVVVDRIIESLANDGYRMQTLITEIVTSYPFTHRRIQPQVASAKP